MDELKIGISMGDDTEGLIKNLLEELEKDDPKVLDDMDIERELQPSKGLAGEPITAGVVITGGAIAISALLRVIERHLEHRQQRWAMRMVAENFNTDARLAAALAGITKKYADVSIKYGIAKEAWASRQK